MNIDNLSIKSHIVECPSTSYVFISLDGQIMFDDAGRVILADYGIDTYHPMIGKLLAEYVLSKGSESESYKQKLLESRIFEIGGDEYNTFLAKRMNTQKTTCADKSVIDEVIDYL